MLTYIFPNHQTSLLDCVFFSGTGSVSLNVRMQNNAYMSLKEDTFIFVPSNAEDDQLFLSPTPNTYTEKC